MSWLQGMPSCLLCVILSYLDATPLYFLAQTCKRFAYYIAETRCLWRYIDARRSPNSPEKIEYIVKRFHENTHTLLLRGDERNAILVPDRFYYKANRFSNLSVLSLENQTLGKSCVTIRSLPQWLRELSLKKTIVANTDFFRNSSDVMLHLRVLILDECHWLNSSAFMSISKYPHLEILSVYKCANVENSIPYLSLSGGCGFTKLKIFDVRLTPLGNTLVHSVAKSGSILALYLQNQDISYKLDYFKRKLDIIKGAHTHDFYQGDDEFDLDDSLTNEENGLNWEDPSNLDDKGLVDYLHILTERGAEELPKSQLYIDPYNPCTCGYEDKQRLRRLKGSKRKPSSPPSHSGDSDDSDGPKGDSALQTIEDRIARLAQIVHRTQVNNTWSRGLFNRNNPQSPLPPTPIINVTNANGDRYRSLHDSRGDVCVMNLANLHAYRPRPHSRVNRSVEAVSQNEIFDMIADAYIGPQERGTENDEYTVRLEEFARREKPTSYYHRDGRKPVPEEGAGPSAKADSEDRMRHIIDVEIRPSTSAENGIPMRQASNEIRKRILRTTSGEPDAKKPKTETPEAEEEAGPSGLGSVPEEPCDSDYSDSECQELDHNRPPTPHPDVGVGPEEAVPGHDNFRRIYFNDSQLIRIMNVDEVAKNVKVPLKRLSLRGYKKITNTTLTYIKDIDLELLDLTYTNVSVEGINNYLVNHPYCRVVHEQFCVCPTNLHF